MVCPDCLSGHVRTETPKGRTAVIHGRDTYIAEPPAGVEPKGVVIMLSDLFGWEFVNSRLLADQYAAKGPFIVYLPNLMSGAAVPVWLTDVLHKVMSTATISDWLWKPWYASQIAFYVLPWIYANRWSVAWPTMRSFVDAVRCSELGKSLPLGVAGFCWGGKHAIVLTHADSVTASGRPLVDASFIAHPSVVSYPDEVEKVRRPISLAIGDRDMSVSMSQVEITRKAWDALKGTVETEIVVYPGANHGFTVRVDHFNGKLLEQCQAAEDQAVNWFKRHFAQENPILS